MGAFIDGVQRRSGGFTPTTQGAMAMPRRRELVPLVRSGSSMDGLVRRVAAVPAMPEISAAEAVAPLPTANPLSAGSSWYLPAALAATTVGIAAGAIGLDTSHLPTLNIASVIPRINLSSHATTAPKTSPTNTNAARAAATHAASLTASQQAMQSTINQQAAAAGVPTGIMTIDLKTGAVASSNADTVFTSASLYKLFVATAVYRGIDTGTIHYSDAATGTNMNVQNCLNAMITQSSNPCGEALGSIVGWDNQNINLHSTGFTHTLLRKNDSEQTSASDVALLLQKLYNGSLVSTTSTTSFINLLKAQQINDRLPVGLPAGATIAHKTGDLNGLAHDAGIVYAPSGNYIVVAMSGPWDTTTHAYSWFAGLSSSLYNSITTARTTK